MLAFSASAQTTPTPAVKLFQTNTYTSTVTAQGLDYTCTFTYSGPTGVYQILQQKCSKNVKTALDKPFSISGEIYVPMGNLNVLNQSMLLGADSFSFAIGSAAGSSQIQLQVSIGSIFQIFFFNTTI